MRKKRILIIEDDHSLKSVFDGVIGSISPAIKIDWVTTHQEAVSKISGLALKKKSYDLLIADIFLEGRSTGLDFWQECQLICPKIPILVMSSLTVDEFLNNLSSDTISPPFLEKPFGIKECRQMIEGLLDHAA